MTLKKREWVPLLAMILFVHFLLFPGTVSSGVSSEDIQRWENNMDIDSLVLALVNKDSAVREAAAKALGRMRDPRAVDPLVNALGDPMEGVRDAAAVALKNLNEPLGERIYESLKGSNKAWDELARINDPRAIVPLVKALRDRHQDVRVAAAWVLEKFVDGRSVDPVVAALGDKYSDVREAAAYTLGRLGDPRAVVPLIDALGDTYGKVREAAVWSLGKFGDRRAVDPLLKTLGDPDPKVREAAAWTLGKLGDRRAVDPLLKSMGDEDPKVREAAAKVLEEMGEPLGRWIQGTLAGSREAGNALVKRKDPRSLDPLIHSLRNRDGQVRRAAATVLGKIRAPRAVDGLVVMAGGWGLRDRVVATAALLEIDQKFFPDLLIDVFRVMARPASLVYLLCIAGIPILVMYGPMWIGRRRGRRI